MCDRLVLIGGGGHCKSVIDSIKSCRANMTLAIVDALLSTDIEIQGVPVVGKDDILCDLWEQGFKNAFITVGSIQAPGVRKELSEKAKEIGFVFPVIKDPTSIVADNVKIDEGTFIGKNVVVNTECCIGKHCIINTGAIVEHECSIGDYTHISVGTVLCGNVTIKDESFVGAGSTIIQGITVGYNSTVGAGSVVLADVDSGSKVFGLVKQNGVN